MYDLLTFTEILEEYRDSFIDREIYVGTMFDIYSNPDSREWRSIYRQSIEHKVPVRFSFVVPQGIVYVGAVPFHAQLTKQARKDFGSQQRGRIEGVVDPIKKEYYIQISNMINPEELKTFNETYFQSKILQTYRKVSERQLGSMEGQMEGFKLDKDIPIDESTIKRVNRVRGGKVQRRKVVAAKPGYKTVDGKAVRMSPQERLKRKRGAVKASRKRRGKQTQIQRSRKKSMRIRKSRGV
jgi:hypothetical protein